MNPSTQVVSPLRQRMIEDMRLRKLNGKTQIAYVRYRAGLKLNPENKPLREALAELVEVQMP